MSSVRIRQDRQTQRVAGSGLGARWGFHVGVRWSPVARITKAKSESVMIESVQKSGHPS